MSSRVGWWIEMASIVQQYVLDGTKQFFFPFPVRVPGNIKLEVEGAGEVPNDQYEVEGIGPASTAVTVRWRNAPSDGSVLRIYREVAVMRVTDFRSDRPITADDLNAEFDNIYRIMQGAGLL